MIRSRPAPSPRPTSSPRRLHRYTGISAGIVLVYLLATGLPLQFTDALGLGSRYVTGETLLDFYGLEAPQPVLFDNGVAQVGESLYWQTQHIAEADTFLGALRVQDLTVIGTAGALLVFAPDDPSMIERIDFAARLEDLGLTESGIVVRTPSELLLLDSLLLNAAPTDMDPSRVSWQRPRLLPEKDAAPYRRAYRQRLLSLERLLQDLHSGRAFGPVGVWVVNLASLLFLLLAISGYLIWWRSKVRRPGS